jgi:hypothetical protein
VAGLADLALAVLADVGGARGLDLASRTTNVCEDCQREIGEASTLAKPVRLNGPKSTASAGAVTRAAASATAPRPADPALGRAFGRGPGGVVCGRFECGMEAFLFGGAGG